MATAIRGAKRGLLTRRQFLNRSASTVAIAGLGSIAKPYLSRAADRPLIASGIQSGDVASDSAVIWARADRPSRMEVAEGPVTFVDTRNNKRDGKLLLKPVQTVINGVPFGRPYQAPFAVR